MLFFTFFISKPNSSSTPDLNSQRIDIVNQSIAMKLIFTNEPNQEQSQQKCYALSHNKNPKANYSSADQCCQLSPLKKSYCHNANHSLLGLIPAAQW